MMHFLNLYLTGQNGGENKPPEVDGEPIGGNPKTGKGSWADKMGKVMEASVKVISRILSLNSND